ncbi:MAG: HAMP domain-containing histidine kinase [Clostridium sp.]|nr:HAMP domain-containing histidine kinase [Clostridium sp.]MCM1171072.1 HAMP domain-containing histidine kinase [Clostridium sp.]MCM1207853.1 HAMP domain-containing histidine kinase [Ruminococcus sp.]
MVCLCLLAAMAVVLAALSIKLYMLKKSAREIRRELADKLSEDTNTLICLSSNDKDMKLLAEDLNVQLKGLREQQLKLSLGDRELKEALTNVSHDIRTPLTAICGYMSLLEKEEKTENAKRYLEIIMGRIEAIKQLTDELLNYSVAISENQQTELCDVVINHVLFECISNFYAALTEKEIVPVIEICEEKVIRRSNKTVLARIFSNIISNAIKYSDGDLTIRLSYDGTVIFSNHSPDLDEISVGRLFDRFYTVETAGRSTGLGLSIAKALTESLGGDISADYHDGVFTVRVVFEGNEAVS